MNRQDFQSLLQMRIRETRSLLKSGHYAGAYYLAGYAIECALKACIAKETPRYDFPPNRKRTEEIYKHSAAESLQAAKLQPLLEVAMGLDPRLRNNWTIVASWSEQSRYSDFSKERAASMIEAIANRNHGVLPWLKRQW